MAGPRVKRSLATALAALVGGIAPAPVLTTTAAPSSDAVRAQDKQQAAGTLTPAQAPAERPATPPVNLASRAYAALRSTNNPVPWWIYAGRRTPRGARADRATFSAGRRC